MNLKRFFIFALTALFATTCLLLTNLNAEYDWESWDGPGGYGAATAWSGWNSPIAETWHDYYISNTIGKPIKYYWQFDAILKWKKRDHDSDGDADEGDLGLLGEWDGDSDRFSFNMNGRGFGDYEIIAKTTLISKVGGVEVDNWEAEDSTSFRWER